MILGSSISAQTVLVTEIESEEGQRLEFKVEGPVGDYVIEWTNDLRSEENWTHLYSKGSDGELLEISDPFSESSVGKFYRIRVLAESEGLHIHGDFAREIHASINLTELQTALGVSLAESDKVLTPLDNLTGARRNARVYAAIVAGFSKLAQGIRDSFDVGNRPSTEEIISAIFEDLASGILDGRNSLDEQIEIGSTGKSLGEFSNQNLVERIEAVKASMDGLGNIVVELNEDGRLSTAVPADWSNFCWGSADWQ